MSEDRVPLDRRRQPPSGQCLPCVALWLGYIALLIWAAVTLARLGTRV